MWTKRPFSVIYLVALRGGTFLSGPLNKMQISFLIWIFFLYFMLNVPYHFTELKVKAFSLHANETAYM